MKLHIKKNNNIPYYPHYNMHLEKKPITTNLVSSSKKYVQKIVNITTNMNIFNILLVVVIVLLLLIIFNKLKK